MDSHSGPQSWPVVTFEQHPWSSSLPEYESRRARLRARGPYESAVVPAIAERALPPLSADLALEVEDALVELSRFDTEVGAIAAPFSAILLRSESASSSEIEHLTSMPKTIALAELGRSTAPNARLIVANVRAMEAAVDLADDLVTESIVAMHEALLGSSAPEMTGDWRTEQVWIGGVGNSPHSADFVPPHHERVPALMTDLVAFARRTDVSALAQIAVTHAQFETIHPFPDGNGRTGRALVHSMFRRLEVTRAVTVPVSAGLLRNAVGYFAALEAYRAGDVEPIIRAFAAASFAAVDNGRALVADITATRAHWAEITTARAGSSGQRLLDLLERQPLVDAARVARELGVALKNAQSGIDGLVSDGILRQVGTAQRSRVYEAPDVLVALDEFARRSKRPSGVQN
jgi:Fic family protein